MRLKHTGSASAFRTVALCAGVLLGGLAGVLPAPLVGIHGALAAPPSCAVFCGKTSFTSGPAHASCLQACRQCGRDVSRVCQGPAGSVCCPSGTTCCPGPVSVSCCSPGTVCDPSGQCVTPRAFCIPTCADTCAGGITGCTQGCDGGTPGCGCVSTTEGASACVQETCTFVACTSSTECGAGAVCFTEGCCGP